MDVPHFPVTISFPPKPNEVFTQEAADNMVGKVSRFIDRLVVCKKAWLVDGAMYMTFDEVE